MTISSQTELTETSAITSSSSQDVVLLAMISAVQYTGFCTGFHTWGRQHWRNYIAYGKRQKEARASGTHTREGRQPSGRPLGRRL